MDTETEKCICGCDPREGVMDCEHCGLCFYCCDCYKLGGPLAHLEDWTAWELGADWAWQKDHVISTGRAIWTDAQITRGYQGVRLQRLEGGATIDERPRIVTRYVQPETKVRLVPRKQQA